MADQAYDRLVAVLHDGRLASGQFVSMPGLVDLLDLPIAATREAVKRANVNGLVEVLPKRGVLVMEAGRRATRDCMDLRALLDQEGARRLVAAGATLPLAALRASHEALIAAAEREMTPDLPRAGGRTDLSLHDALATGLANPLAAEAYRVNRDRIAVIQNTRPFLPDRIVPAMREHLAIIEALERRDAEAAVAAIAVHFRLTLRWWGILEAAAARHFCGCGVSPRASISTKRATSAAAGLVGPEVVQAEGQREAVLRGQPLEGRLRRRVRGDGGAKLVGDLHVARAAVGAIPAAVGLGGLDVGRPCPVIRPSATSRATLSTLIRLQMLRRPRGV